VKREADCGTLDRETAQKLEISTKRAIVNLIGAGAMIDGVPEAEQFDRRAILAAVRDVKLLGPGKSGDESPASTPPNDR
jgi:hypothetical protein